MASASGALAERRLFVLLPFGLVLGAVAYVGVGAEPAAWSVWAIALAIVAALWISRNNLAHLRLAVLASSLAGGFGLMIAHGQLFGTPMLSGAEYGTYEATVAGILSEGDGERRIVVGDVVPVPPARPLPIDQARLVVPADPPLGRGDRIRAPIRFAEVPGPVLPFAFDSAFHAYFSGIGAYGNATGAVQTVSTGKSTTDRWIESIRHGIADRIAGRLAQPAAGIARALTIGDQTQVTEAARDVMATAGIAHVLSVSGLHLTLVAVGVFAIVRMLMALSVTIGQRFPVKKLAAAVGIASALFYYALASGPAGNVAALRATVMIVLVLGAVLFGRRALTMRNVAIAALVVVVTDPASIFRASFQLSFAAVVALIGAYEMTKRREQGEPSVANTVWRYGAGIVVTSLIAGAATALFSAYHFQQLSPLGVLGNLFTLPIVGFVMMPAALLSVLAMPFGFEGLILPVVGWSIEAMLWLAAIVTQWSGPFEGRPVLLPWMLVAGLLALAWFAFFKDGYRLIGPIVALPLILAFGVDRPPDVLVADTTQAIAMRDGGELVLIAGRDNTFAVDVWSERYGDIAPAAEGEVGCDSEACVATSDRGFAVSVVRAQGAFAEDCAVVDLIVTRIAAPAACAATATVIDAETLREGGVQWLYWRGAGQGFELRPAIADQGRPWRPTP